MNYDMYSLMNKTSIDLFNINYLCHLAYLPNKGLFTYDQLQQSITHWLCNPLCPVRRSPCSICVQGYIHVKGRLNT